MTRSRTFPNPAPVLTWENSEWLEKSLWIVDNDLEATAGEVGEGTVAVGAGTAAAAEERDTIVRRSGVVFLVGGILAEEDKNDRDAPRLAPPLPNTVFFTTQDMAFETGDGDDFGCATNNGC